MHTVSQPTEPPRQAREGWWQWQWFYFALLRPKAGEQNKAAWCSSKTVQRYNIHTTDGSGDNNWSYKTCKAPVKMSLPTNQSPVFLQARCPSCYPTNSIKAAIIQHIIRFTSITSSHANHNNGHFPCWYGLAGSHSRDLQGSLSFSQRTTTLYNAKPTVSKHWNQFQMLVHCSSSSSSSRVFI